jgi:hypothetical protein
LIEIKKTKLTTNAAALIIIFSIGLIPVVASTMRLCEIVMSGNAIQTGMAWQQADSSWYVFPYLVLPTPSNIRRTWAWVPVWSQIEVDIGIVTACLPCLSPLLRLVWGEVSAPRTMTPSMVELPKYSGSWDSMDSRDTIEEEKEKKTREKELPALPKGSEERDEKEYGKVTVKISSYYDDASDEEEARDVGVTSTLAKRVERSRKLS